MDKPNIKGFLLLIAVVALMLQCGYVKAGGRTCTPAEKQSIVYKWANKEFYSAANRKPEKFLWSDYEAEKLMNEVLKKANKRANLICSS